MATNVMNAGSYTTLIQGTIPSSGTLSQEFDLSTWKEFGLHVHDYVGGSLSFMASDTPMRVANNYALIRNLDGTAISTGAMVGTAVISGDAMSFLKPFRYVKFLSSTVQPGVATITLIAKA